LRLRLTFATHVIKVRQICRGRPRHWRPALRLALTISGQRSLRLHYQKR
jgi:hypothetical protein